MSPQVCADNNGMNIKGLISGLQPNQIKPVEKIQRAVKSDITHDRDSNGRQEFAQTEDDIPDRAMSDEEIKKVMDFLSQLKVVKEHNWSLVLERDRDKTYVVIKDNLGTIIRRIPEHELWSLNIEENAGRSGQILRKRA
jgi:uncharacterized FlaG/YvyC family protein